MHSFVYKYRDRYMFLYTKHILVRKYHEAMMMIVVIVWYGKELCLFVLFFGEASRDYFPRFIFLPYALLVLTGSNTYKYIRIYSLHDTYEFWWDFTIEMSSLMNSYDCSMVQFERIISKYYSYIYHSTSYIDWVI